MIPGGLDILAKNMGRAAARRHRSTDMKTKTVYIASDGSEHESPQEAATWDLNDAMEKIVRDGGCTDHDCLDDLIGELARNPEALRDALNTYFEALEEHPDVEPEHHRRAREIVDSWPDWKRGFQITQHSPSLEDVVINSPVRVAPQGDPDDPTTWRADLPVDRPSYCRPFGTRED